MRPAAPLTDVSSAPSRTRFESMGRNELAFGALPDFLLRHKRGSGFICGLVLYSFHPCYVGIDEEETFMANITYEPTPNPQTMKYHMGCQISEESLNFDDPIKAERSPLAKKIFGFPWAAGVFIGTDFLTITKQDWVEWEIIAEPLAKLLAEHLDSGLPIVVEVFEKREGEVNENDSPVVKKIKELLNLEIRPAVAMDGGDIKFHKYEDNILYLQMQGACSGCPSAAMTLKNGIEMRVRELIPEVKEVVSI